MTLNMKVQQVMDATIVLSTIIRDNRRLPTKGKYWLSRLHAKLLPIFNKYNDERDAAIAVFNFYPEVPNPENHLSDEARQAMIEGGMIAQVPPKMITSKVMAVPPDQMKAFTDNWRKTGETEIEVDVTPIQIDVLCFPGDLADGEITAHEFIILGDLIYE